MFRPNSILNTDSTHKTLFPKYPCRRRVYAEIIGSIAEQTIQKALRVIGKKLTVLGYTVLNHNVYANGTDITCIDNKTHDVLTFEVVQLGKDSYVSYDKALSIRSNLKGSKYKGLIVFGYLNVERSARKILKNIKILHFPFMVIPRHFYDFYNARNGMLRKKIAGSRTFKLVMNRVLGFLTVLRFYLPMYVFSNNNEYIVNNNVSRNGFVVNSDDDGVIVCSVVNGLVQGSTINNSIVQNFDSLGCGRHG